MKKITLRDLEAHIWEDANILRGSINAWEFRHPIMAILFLKRLNDQFEEKVEKLEAQGIPKKEALKDFNHTFFVPRAARWDKLQEATTNIGTIINAACRAIEKENANLKGVFANINYADHQKYPDDKLGSLITHFDKFRLRNSDFEKEDIFGDAYEYLLEKFVDVARKQAGEFFTPREVVKLLVRIVKPQEGMRICDPTCGSGGMLIVSKRYVEKNGGDPQKITLYGQESVLENLAMCKMNMVLHDIEDFELEHGDVLADPKLFVSGRLDAYDRVLANFPFSMKKWPHQAEDTYGRFQFGTPPKSQADFAFIQHMFSQLHAKGQAAIICSHGVLSRKGAEKQIRKNMVDADVVEGVIALPGKLFFGTQIGACVLLLRKSKPRSKRKRTIFVDATRDKLMQPTRNKLRPEDIEKIVSAYDNFVDVERYCHVADTSEIQGNDYELSVPRYVDTSEPEEHIDIQKTINELKELKKLRSGLEAKTWDDLRNLKFKA